MIKIEIENSMKTAIDKLHAVRDEWVRLQTQADDKLYTLLNGSLALCRLAQKSDAHLLALKELCKFKWGKKTKVSTLVAKIVFGSELKQVHAYAKVLEIAIELGIGLNDATDMITWLRSSGGVSGITRHQKSEESESVEHIDYERKLKIFAGRNIENFDTKARVKLAVDSRHLDKFRSSEMLLFCKLDRSASEMTV